MATTKEDISRWFDDGVEKGATHLIVVCDTFDYGDYPKYVMPGEDAKEKASNLGSMQSLMEVYNLSMDKDTQLKTHRAFNY